jgi:hypothetical protein
MQIVKYKLEYRILNKKYPISNEGTLSIFIPFYPPANEDLSVSSPTNDKILINSNNTNAAQQSRASIGLIVSNEVLVCGYG